MHSRFAASRAVPTRQRLPVGDCHHPCIGLKGTTIFVRKTSCSLYGAHCAFLEQHAVETSVKFAKGDWQMTKCRSHLRLNKQRSELPYIPLASSQSKHGLQLWFQSQTSRMEDETMWKEVCHERVSIKGATWQLQYNANSRSSMCKRHDSTHQYTVCPYRNQIRL